MFGEGDQENKKQGNTVFALSFALNPGFVWSYFSVDGIKQGRKHLCKVASCLDLGRGERI